MKTRVQIQEPKKAWGCTLPILALGKGCRRKADPLGSLFRHPNWHAPGRSQGEILSHKTRWTDPKEWHLRLISSFHMHEHRYAHSTAHTFVPTHINTQAQESSESSQSSYPVYPQHRLLFSHFPCLSKESYSFHHLLWNTTNQKEYSMPSTWIKF